MDRLLLIAPYASYRTVPFLNAARKMDVDVLIASEGSCSATSIYSGGLRIDFADPDASLAAILREAALRPFAAVIGTDDKSVELAALANERLGLPFNPVEAARIARRKDRARARLAQAGLNMPGHRVIDLRMSLAAQMEGIRYPCVLKPVALSASRGVIRADDAPAFLAACGRIGQILHQAAHGDEARYLLAEDFIPGRELALEGLLTAGRLELLALFDKPDPLDGPYFEETYYITPSRLPAPTQAAVQAQVQAACRAYGLREGPVHAECRINDHGVWILEVAARSIGGLCGRLLRFGTGHGLEELVIAHALGRPPSRRAVEGAAGVLMIPIPKAGILRRVEGMPAARRIPHIEELEIDVREGSELVPLPEGSSYLGFIFARAPTPAAAEAALRASHACLDFVIAPLWKGALAVS